MHLHQDTLISLYKVLALAKKLANIVWLSFKWREQTDHHNFSMCKRRVNCNDEDPGLSFAKIKIRRVSTSKPSNTFITRRNFKELKTNYQKNYSTNTSRCSKTWENYNLVKSW